MKFTQRNKIPGFDENIMPFVFLSAYESLVKNNLKCDYLLAYSENQNAIMPLKKYSVKGFVLIQPLYAPVTLNGNRLTKEGEKYFLNELVEKITEQKLAIRITQAYSYTVFYAIPDKSISCPFGSYVVNLTHTQEDLFRSIHARRRTYIREAERQNTEIRWGTEHIETFYSLYKQTMDRSNIYCEPFEYFKHLSSQLPNNIICGVVYLDNKPQGGLCIAHTQYGAYYLYGASSDNVGLNGAINYLHWQTILLLKSKDVQRYDFAGARLSDVTGTKLEGIQNFKKRFGGELMQGYLWKKDIDVLQCRLFDNLLGFTHFLKRKKLLKDIIDEELEKHPTSSIAALF